MRCPSRTPEVARFPRQKKAMLHCDLRVRWKVASDLRFRAAISEPKTPSFCGISADLAQSTRKSLAIAIVRFWCAKPLPETPPFALPNYARWWWPQKRIRSGVPARERYQLLAAHRPRKPRAGTPPGPPPLELGPLAPHIREKWVQCVENWCFYRETVHFFAQRWGYV